MINLETEKQVVKLLTISVASRREWRLANRDPQLIRAGSPRFRERDQYCPYFSGRSIRHPRGSRWTRNSVGRTSYSDPGSRSANRREDYRSPRRDRNCVRWCTRREFLDPDLTLRHYGLIYPGSNPGKPSEAVE
jgi:hypothetical protein